MPWKEICPVEQRLDFLLRYRSGTLSVAQRCRLFGISRQTGHKWINRFSPGASSVASLQDVSRRPLHSPASTSALLVQRIIARPQTVPCLGCAQILWLLQKQWPQVEWPHPSTVNDILKRHGCPASGASRRQP
jgi:putative transposase